MSQATRREFLQTGTLALASAGLSIPATAADRPVSKGEKSSNHNDPELHLFVDDEEIDKSKNLKRELNRPRKQPSPVLVADQPWEGERAQAWGSVLLDPDGKLRMWYFAFNSERRANELDRGGYAYAESTDGIKWDKPALGVVDF